MRFSLIVKFRGISVSNTNQINYLLSRRSDLLGELNYIHEQSRFTAFPSSRNRIQEIEYELEAINDRINTLMKVEAA